MKTQLDGVEQTTRNPNLGVWLQGRCDTLW